MLTHADACWQEEVAPLAEALLPLLLASIQSEDGVCAEYGDAEADGALADAVGGDESEEDDDIRAITVRTAWLDEKVIYCLVYY
jgi:hypothetical protein